MSAPTLLESLRKRAEKAEAEIAEKDAEIARLRSVIEYKYVTIDRMQSEHADEIEQLAESRKVTDAQRRESITQLIEISEDCGAYEEGAEMEANWSAPCSGKSAFHAVPHPMRGGCPEPGEHDLPCWRVGKRPRFIWDIEQPAAEDVKPCTVSDAQRREVQEFLEKHLRDDSYPSAVFAHIWAILEEPAAEGAP